MSNTTKISAVLILSCLIPAHAESPTIPRSYFRVISPNGAEDSYLLGTAHFSVDLSEFPGDVEKQIKSSRSVSVERVMTEPDIEAYARNPMAALASMKVPGGTPVDPATLSKLVRYGIPREVAAKLSDSDCGALAAYGRTQIPGLPLDVRVMRAAYQAKVTPTALDSDEVRRSAQALQAQAAGGCGLRQLFAENSVDDLREYFIKDARDGVAEYRQGEIAGEDELNQPIVVSRNLAWMPSVLKNLEAGRAFVATGADHLFGHNGLIALLQRRGYRVEEVTAASPRYGSPSFNSPGVAR